MRSSGMQSHAMAKLAGAAIAAFSFFGFVSPAGLARPAATSLTGNAYFPLVVGAKWTYKATSGPAAGSSFTTRVLSGHATSAGIVVSLETSPGAGASLRTQYVIRSNGSIEVGGTSSGSAKLSFASNGNYFIPTARQVTSCHPCVFSGTFTTDVGPMSIREQMTESVTSIGMQHVAVPAGSFSAEKMLFSMKITGAEEGVTMETTTQFYDYLAKNVGVVESGGGTVKSTVAGHTITSSIGTEELVRYTA